MKTVFGIRVGDQFGMLTLINTDVARKENKYKAIFECMCGMTKEIYVWSVKSGSTKSCGCANGDLQKINGGIRSKAHMAWTTFGGQAKLPFYKFLEIFKGIEEPDNSMTAIGVMPKKIAANINNAGCAKYPALLFCVFISGRDGTSKAARKTGFGIRTIHRYSKENPEVYAAGLQARAERDAASKPAPPSLPVNTSVDF